MPTLKYNVSYRRKSLLGGSWGGWRVRRYWQFDSSVKLEPACDRFSWFLIVSVMMKVTAAITFLTFSLKLHFEFCPQNLWQIDEQVHTQSNSSSFNEVKICQTFLRADKDWRGRGGGGERSQMLLLLANITFHKFHKSDKENSSKNV